MMTHWDIARCTMIGAFLGFCVFAGWTLGGLVYGLG
jgi:hypothetical protein